MSAIKSAIVKSTSWPTALITGVFDSNMAFATISSLNDHRSSMLPPPLPTIKVSRWKFWLYRICLAIFSAEPWPWTSVGKSNISHNGQRLSMVVIMSWMAAPVWAVTTPIFLGNLGIGFLCSSLKYPSFSSLFFNWL